MGEEQMEERQVILGGGVDGERIMGKEQMCRTAVGYN